MTTPTAAYLDKARKALQEARAVAAIELPEAAGRAGAHFRPHGQDRQNP